MGQSIQKKSVEDSSTIDRLLPNSSLSVHNPGPHLDHLLRQTRMHHQQLSVMADSKAQMLITISSLVMTLSLPLLLETDLRLTALALMVSALGTVLLASYAIMPKHISDKLKPNTPGNTPTNLLFFGHFVNMPYDIYEAAWQEILNSPDLSYQVQIQEIYGLGQYLAAYKYRYLRFAYFVFLGGLLLAALLAVATVLSLF